jgi:hypothetical protein
MGVVDGFARDGKFGDLASDHESVASPLMVDLCCD